MQSRQLIVFKLPAAVVSARSLTQLARLLKNVLDCNSFSSQLTRLSSGAASGAEMTLCLREKASDGNASEALDYLAPAVSKRAVTQIERSFRVLIDDASDVAADIRFAGLTAMSTP